MPSNRDNRSAAENGTGILGAMTGLGIVSFALFPFLIPGLAIIGLFLVPLLPVALAGALVGAIAIGPFLAIRAIRRRFVRRATASASAVARAS